MRNTVLGGLFVAALFFVSAAGAFAQTAGAEPAALKQMSGELSERDAALFDAVFVTCDFARLEAIVTDDFEFYHDRAGNNATSGKQFVDSIRGACERRKAGTDLRVRRELIPNSLVVYPLNNYGAVQTGEHRFYILSEKGEQLAEVAKFIHLWKKENGVWRLARVISYEHKPAK